MKIPVRNNEYLTETTFEQDVLTFSGFPLSYWKGMRHGWHITHNNNTDDLIDSSKNYTHDELIKICNHPIYNAYGYAELSHKSYHTNDHLNSSDRPWMKNIYEFCYPGKKILDYGCGDLTNAICFYDIGYATTVIDMPIDWIKFIEYRCKKYGVNIDFKYTYNNHTFLSENDNFDIIFTHEVLEHVKDPESVIKYLVQHLKIGGILFITVTFTEGAFHLKENHDKFGYGSEGNVHYHPEWMKILNNLYLKSIGNDFYIKEA